eukprot:scaffold1397_cov254-Pinguiococcus_pyrenoidosus.AAC.11
MNAGNSCRAWAAVARRELCASGCFAAGRLSSESARGRASRRYAQPNEAITSATALCAGCVARATGKFLRCSAVSSLTSSPSDACLAPQGIRPGRPARLLALHDAASTATALSEGRGLERNAPGCERTGQPARSAAGAS